MPIHNSIPGTRGSYIHLNFSTLDAGLEVFRAIKSQVEFFWVVTQYSVDGEDGGSMVIKSTDILPQHYTASQPRRTQLVPTLIRSSIL
jgi:hypothetical protein